MTTTETAVTPVAALRPLAPGRPAPRPDLDPDKAGTGEKILIATFVVVPMLALIAAVPLAWGWGVGWHDIVIAAVFYTISGLGISMGFHRYFTHSSFKANRGLKIALAIAGSLAIEGPVLTWTADHRRHHKYSDKEGDPHSPWRFGSDWKALIKGLGFAHIGWMFEGNRTSKEKFVPDLLAGPDRRPVVHVVAGRCHGVLLGQPGPDRLPAPRHLVDQLHLPHLRQGRVRR